MKLEVWVEEKFTLSLLYDTCFPRRLIHLTAPTVIGLSSSSSQCSLPPFHKTLPYKTIHHSPCSQYTCRNGNISNASIHQIEMYMKDITMLCPTIFLDDNLNNDIMVNISSYTKASLSVCFGLSFNLILLIKCINGILVHVVHNCPLQLECGSCKQKEYFINCLWNIIEQTVVSWNVFMQKVALT